MLKQVQDKPTMFRDMRSNVVMNVDNVAYGNRMKQKQVAEQHQKQIETLNEQLAEVRQIVNQLLEFSKKTA